MMGGVVLATQTIENEMKAVVFALKQKEYAIDVKHVVSIEKCKIIREFLMFLLMLKG